MLLAEEKALDVKILVIKYTLSLFLFWLVESRKSDCLTQIVGVLCRITEKHNSILGTLERQAGLLSHSCHHRSDCLCTKRLMCCLIMLCMPELIHGGQEHAETFTKSAWLKKNRYCWPWVLTHFPSFILCSQETSLQWGKKYKNPIGISVILERSGRV